MMDCATLSVPEAARVLGVGRIAMYQAVRDGRVPALRVGRKPKFRVPRPVIDRLLADPERFNRAVKEAAG
jgi:excisionase family DNA binding protein